MKKTFVWISCAAVLAPVALGARLAADEGAFDFGLAVQHALREHSDELFGISHPLTASTPGPFTGADSTAAIQVADHLHVSLVSSSVHPSADMIAMWPDDSHPTHLFVCDESSSNPAVQRVNLSQPAASNATTVVTGLSSCDPIRRTPWGSIIAGEESTTGGIYELMNPMSVSSPIAVINRATGATSDPRLVKRKAIGQLAFEGQAIVSDGTMYFGDELRPGGGGAAGGNPGGAVYKFIPDFPFSGSGTITDPSLSPFASGQLFGLRVGAAADNGQGTEIGQGVWVDIPELTYMDPNGNIVLRNAQSDLKFTGYYRLHLHRLR